MIIAAIPAVLSALALPVSDATPVAGLTCMLANDGEGSAPVYAGPTSPQVVFRSMPIVMAVLEGNRTETRAGRVHIRTPSNNDGWVDARLLRPYARCTPVLTRDVRGAPMLGFK